MKSNFNFKKVSALFVLLVLADISNVLNAQIYIGSKCKIGFFSKTKMENIDATNSISIPVLNSKNGAFAIKASQTAFKFKSALMQEHYNENYMESEKFPFATFTGTVNETIDYSLEQINQVTMTGNLNMHGVDQQLSIPGTLEIKNGKVILNSNFLIKMVDFKIKVPSLLAAKIAEEVSVTLYAELAKR